MTRYSIRGSLAVMRTIRDACDRANADMQHESVVWRSLGLDELATMSLKDARPYYDVWAALCGVIGEQS